MIMSEEKNRVKTILDGIMEEAAEKVLLELNDEETRKNFRVFVLEQISEKLPEYLHSHYIYCDQWNNTPDVVNRNEFVADITFTIEGEHALFHLKVSRVGVDFFDVIGRK